MSKNHNYWQANMRLIALCLSIWFVVSFLFGIILVDALNSVSIGGYKLGFIRRVDLLLRESHGQARSRA
jgi:uncharacterized membrane protein